MAGPPRDYPIWAFLGVFLAIGSLGAFAQGWTGVPVGLVFLAGGCWLVWKGWAVSEERGARRKPPTP